MSVLYLRKSKFDKVTGKPLSEALFFATTNQQYDDRLFIELQVQYITIPSLNLGRTCWVQKLFLTFRKILCTTCSPYVLQKEELLKRFTCTKAKQDTASEALSSDKVKRRFLKTLSKIDLFIIKMVDDLDEKKNADHCNFENNQTYFF